MKKMLSFFLFIIIAFSAVSAPAMATSNTSLANSLAADLKELGLFQGVSATDFDLDRAPTRVEALVMLIRVMGQESTALQGNWTHPFRDVPAWADRYIGFAYDRGLANGVSPTSFGTGTASAAMYTTFMLRALGYSDAAGGEFTWDAPFRLAESVGILPEQVDTSNFLRADVVVISYAALPVCLKNSEQTLADTLIAAGVFTAGQYNRSYHTDALSTAETADMLNAEEIYDKCSPAVFYIEVYDRSGSAYASGSGFFIASDGTAVTNYHVLEGASSAVIILSSSGEQRQVAGIYDYSVEHDWAIIKVDGAGYPYLKIGGANTTVGGAEIFAIGSPLGLQNTISEGLISNPKRSDGATDFIQISAAISHGSSGGALINKFGEVIGITSAFYEGGQNLNLAIPTSYFSNYTRGSLLSVAQATPPVTGSLYLDEYSLTLDLDEYSYVTVSALADTDEETYVSYFVGDDAVVSCAWGEWYGDNIDLYIYPAQAGTAVVTVGYYLTADDTLLATQDFLVTVNGGQLYLSQNTVYVPAYGSRTVNVSVNCGTYEGYYYVHVDPSYYLRYSFGDFWDQTVPLTISGLGTRGTYLVPVKLYTQDDEFMGETLLTVIVV